MHLCPVQRAFVKNLFFLQILNWLIKPIWIFGIDRLAQIQLGDEWYGTYYVIFGTSLLFNILLDFGLNNYLAAEVAKTGEIKIPRSILKLRLLLALCFVILMAVVGIWQKFPPEILAIVIVNQVLAGFVLFYRAILQGRHLFRVDSVVSVTDRFVAILVCAILLIDSPFKGKTGVLLFLGAQTLGYVLALALALIAAVKGSKTAVSDNNPGIRTVLKSTAWFTVLAFVMAIFTRVDTLMIKNLSPGSYSDAGIYARSFRLLDAALIFSTLISTMLLPVFSRMIHQGQNTDKLFWLNLRIVLFVAIPVLFTALYFNADILMLLYSKSLTNYTMLQYSSAVFVPVLSSFLPMALVHVVGTWLTAAGKIKLLVVLSVLSLLLNVLLNFILIPAAGSMGAGFACFITQSVFALGCLIFAYRNGAFQINWKRIILLAAWIVVSGAIFWSLDGWILGLNGFYIACIVYFIATILSGVFWPEMKLWIQSKKKQ